MNHTPLGQRIQKNSNGETTYFNYDEQGQLIGEYDTDGNAIREYVYLGNVPIGLLSSERENEILQVHTDHLGTPRVVSDKAKEVLWRLEGDQFGDVQPQVETITMPLRHAGQYHDAETGLFYNYFRYYDPKSGRYLRSDPIGLAGGLNTYGYVGGDPLSWTDPFGLVYGAGVDNVDPSILPAIPQGLYDASVGMGDGIIYAMSFGFGNGQVMRDYWLGYDGGLNRCSDYYYYGHITGQVGGNIVGVGGTAKVGVKGLDFATKGYGIKDQMHRMGKGDRKGRMIFRYGKFRLQTQNKWGRNNNAVRPFFQRFYAKLPGKTNRHYPWEFSQGHQIAWGAGWATAFGAGQYLLIDEPDVGECGCE